uniref:Uncharacterized protein n=1 Tax=Ascaris lumbricoides TaxID=6252 RepID=A0A9J2P608_ASCLU
MDPGEDSKMKGSKFGSSEEQSWQNVQKLDRKSCQTATRELWGINKEEDVPIPSQYLQTRPGGRTTSYENRMRSSPTNSPAQQVPVTVSCFVSHNGPERMHAPSENCYPSMEAVGEPGWVVYGSKFTSCD